MDFIQMLKKVQTGKNHESKICPKCEDTGLTIRLTTGGKEPIFFSCPAGDREAKKRIGKNGKVQGECEVKLIGFKS